MPGQLAGALDFHGDLHSPPLLAQCRPGVVYYLCSVENGYVVEMSDSKEDTVNHPAHYTNHPSGVECIQITEHMGFNLGNAVKYIWRADLKGKAIEDLEKAEFYIRREIEKRRRK